MIFPYNIIFIIVGFALFIGGPVLLRLAAGSINFKYSKQPWYKYGKLKPYYRPPRWAWFTIFPAITASATYANVRIWKSPDSPARTISLCMYLSQALLNVAWSPLFFIYKNMALSAASLWAVSTMNFSTIMLYTTIDPMAGLLCVPYQIWCIIALAVNTNSWKHFDPKKKTFLPDGSSDFEEQEMNFERI